MTNRNWRVWGSIIAICGWSGLLLQVVLAVLYVHSFSLALWHLLLFFTNISNVMVAIVFTGIAMGSSRLRHPLLMAGSALTMALVGVVFELMLRKIVHPTGWRLVTNGLLHDVVPLLTIGAWLLLAEKGRLRARDPWLIAIVPIVYLGYALLRGAFEGVYPYPFIDPGKIGWEGVTAYVFAISVIFLIVAHLMVVLDHWLARGSVAQGEPQHSFEATTLAIH